MWANVVEVSGISLVIIGLVYLIVLGITSADGDDWQENDNHSPVTCYTHIHYHHNGFLTPGRSWDEFHTYCLDKSK